MNKYTVPAYVCTIAIAKKRQNNLRILFLFGFARIFFVFLGWETKLSGRRGQRSGQSNPNISVKGSNRLIEKLCRIYASV
jgi:hypothetical protein